MEGKTILVTGAARRLGSAIAREMHATGANIMVHYHQAPAQRRRRWLPN
jgi:pteridine reductase